MGDVIALLVGEEVGAHLHLSAWCCRVLDDEAQMATGLRGRSRGLHVVARRKCVLVAHNLKV